MVDAALAASAFLMGLAGSPHCAVMCGAPCAAVVGTAGPGRVPAGLPALQAGRLIGYAAAGALIAAGTASAAAMANVRLLQPLWTMLHVGAIVLGAWLVWTARAPAWLSAAPSQLARIGRGQPVRVFRRLPRSGRAGVAGLCLTALPCGLLQSALLVAALASGPLAGATVMASFAVASSIGLWLGPQLLHGLVASGRGERAMAISLRLAGLLLVLSSLFAVWHGLGDALCRIFL